jgi:hypothetical protein
MASKRNPDGSADYYVRNPDAVGASPTPQSHPNASIKKNVVPTAAGKQNYQNQQQNPVPDKGGA